MGASVAAALVVSLFVNAQIRRTDDPCRADAAPPEELALMPGGLSLEGIGTVTDVTTEDSYISIQAVTPKPPDEATILIQDAVVAAGYRPAGMDSEQAEAEVFFTRGEFAAGQARVQPSACPGRFDIGLVLLDPEVAS